MRHLPPVSSVSRSQRTAGRFAVPLGVGVGGRHLKRGQILEYLVEIVFPDFDPDSDSDADLQVPYVLPDKHS